MKKVNWFFLLSLLIFPAMFYGFGYFVSKPLYGTSWVNISHWKLILGGSGLWISLMVYIFYLPFIVGFGYSHCSWRKKLGWKILSSFGFLFAFLQFLSSLIMFMYGMGTFPKDPRPDLFRSLLIFHLVTLTYVTLFAFFVWNRYTVSENALMLIDGKLLYPGENYITWPFLTYEFKAVKQDILVEEYTPINCTDGKFNLKLKTIVKLNVKEAKKLRIASLDYQKIVQKVEETIPLIIRNRAQKMTLGELLNYREEYPMLLYGFPLIWEDNDTVYSFSIKNN